MPDLECAIASHDAVAQVLVTLLRGGPLCCCCCCWLWVRRLVGLGICHLHQQQCAPTPHSSSHDTSIAQGPAMRTCVQTCQE
jgi:hypothetical protein